MEVIEYAHPTGWNSKGMDWDAPDPRRADYVMAVKDALMERANVCGHRLSAQSLAISPWKPVTRSMLEAVVGDIASMAGEFLDDRLEEYRSDWSDFPRMWSWRALVEEEGCELYDYPEPGTALAGNGAWLARIKNALDRLHIVRCDTAWCTRVYGYGSVHDPPFGQSIADALDGERENENSTDHDWLQPSVMAWSGNTHWTDDGGDDGGENGYCGYAELETWWVKRASVRHPTLEFDFLAYVLAKAPEGAAPYSEVLQSSTFDGGDSGLVEGMQVVSVHGVPGEPFEDFHVGSTYVPENQTVPTSHFDNNDWGNTVRRSAKTGFAARCWSFLDYAVPGGFTFQ